MAVNVSTGFLSWARAQVEAGREDFAGRSAAKLMEFIEANPGTPANFTAMRNAVLDHDARFAYAFDTLFAKFSAEVAGGQAGDFRQ